MSDYTRDQLRGIKNFPELVNYLRDELDWPIEAEDFEDLTFEYEPEELGIDPGTAAKISEIKQLRPLANNQPWGIFFIGFEPKRLPVVVLRRILSKLVIKKRTSVKKAEQAVWNLHDLLFISNYGEGEQRQITFAHFSQDEVMGDLPTLKVLGWDDADTALHLDHVHQELATKLCWPKDERDFKGWRDQWSSAFILRNREVVTTSQELAIRLAGLAQRIRNRVNRVLAVETERGPMRKLYKAFQEALIHDLKEDDFADMYAQTIAYGLLAARFSRPMGIVVSNITDMVPNTNPFLKDMLSTFINTGGRQSKIDFDELGIQDVVELLNSPDTHMEDVLRDFGNRTRQEDPVIHFYELFLSEYDKKKKVERGVFYTPQPVVSYIVRSIHELLQKEFGLEDGLADITTWGEMAKRNKDIKIPAGVSPEEPFVQILDPAVGTATFLVEVIDVIYKTMTAKWNEQGHKPLDILRLWNDYVPNHLLPRLYGFELMMAPYAIAHMRLGLKLDETDYRFGKDTPRANIYLTNSLEPATDAKSERVFDQWAPALAHEAKVVNTIKSQKRFTIVLGNPPYSARSYNLTQYARGLIGEYKQIAGIRLQEKGALQLEKNLNDDYVKFLRLAQIMTKEQNSIISMITNHSFLENPTLRGMRYSLIKDFGQLYFLDLHGNIARKEKSLNGEPDENVFDIGQGVAISVLLRSVKTQQLQQQKIRRGDLFGSRNLKYEWLKKYSIREDILKDVRPTPSLFLFRTEEADKRLEYSRYVSVTELFPINSTGVKTHRDGFCIDFEMAPLKERICELRDATISNTELRNKYGLEDTYGWKMERSRLRLQKNDGWANLFNTILYRPFDFRYIYFSPDVIELPRMEVSRNFLKGTNLGLVFMRQATGSELYSHFLATRYPVDNRAFYSNRGTMNFAPLYIVNHGGLESFNDKDRVIIQPNLDKSIIKKMELVLKMPYSLKPEDENSFGPVNLFYYIYSIFHSVTYRERYDEFLKVDYPCFPLPTSAEIFQRLSNFGKELVALHLMESSHLNKDITKFKGNMPSCKIEKIIFDVGNVWLDKAQSEGFVDVPEEVWTFYVGGYQVCQKWLKDRKGRSLSAVDIAHYQKIILALNETIKLMGNIDNLIDQHGGWPLAFTTRL